MSDVPVTRPWFVDALKRCEDHAARLESRIEYLLRVAGKRAPCPDCDKDVIFLSSPDGKQFAFELDGRDHLLDCKGVD